MNVGAGDALAQPLASRATEDPSAEPVRLLLSIRGEAGGAMRTRIASRREEPSVPPIGAVPLFDEPGTLDTVRQTSRSLLLPPEAVASMRLARATAPGAKV